MMMMMMMIRVGKPWVVDWRRNRNWSRFRRQKS